MIRVSDNAKAQVVKLKDDQSVAQEAFIRVGVKGGGCSGLTYLMDFDTQLEDDDKVFEDKGVQIVVDKKSFLYLVVTELDYA